MKPLAKILCTDQRRPVAGRFMLVPMPLARAMHTKFFTNTYVNLHAEILSHLLSDERPDT